MTGELQFSWQLSWLCGMARRKSVAFKKKDKNNKKTHLFNVREIVLIVLRQYWQMGKGNKSCMDTAWNLCQEDSGEHLSVDALEKWDTTLGEIFAN